MFVLFSSTLMSHQYIKGSLLSHNDFIFSQNVLSNLAKSFLKIKIWCTDLITLIHSYWLFQRLLMHLWSIILTKKKKKFNLLQNILMLQFKILGQFLPRHLLRKLDKLVFSSVSPGVLFKDCHHILVFYHWRHGLYKRLIVSNFRF